MNIRFLTKNIQMEYYNFRLTLDLAYLAGQPSLN